ncbi:protein phosphatase 1-binding protein bifocal isoform X1 [Megachile rotundata]|uniref:protein phosphatase 1-binding protein bifocal isoform X1 n=1 Tax=Megachile rotundata TaxID=143995 RepID=UPI003FD25AF7
MATASNAMTSAGETSGNNVPQWKRDLIQRRRQQNKVLANNGANVKLCSAVIGPSATSSSTDTVDPSGGQEQSTTGNVSSRTRTASTGEENSNSSSGNGGSAIAGVVVSSSPFFSRGPACGAIVGGGAVAAVDVAGSAVACNMRLEADLSFCSDSEDVANGALNKSSTDTERKSEHGDGSENEDAKGGDPLAGCDERRATAVNKVEKDVLMELSKNKSEMARNRASSDDGESDSSEELQYGPGIVNKLKSKYLNLTLRETNRSRVSVQRFRRAASLEDLLDCDDEPNEKSTRKYAKRTAPGAATKTDRYRNASRGNESMKRARSVETLLRYNGTDEVASGHGVTGRVAANGLKQEPVNDHIILIDRTTVKIESRLGELDRPKAVNKPKRIKPLLAETERPPPDLVKTTMRIFEGSAKKLKPKGEVAAKVATFKTINDTYKAQTQKKLVPKPPVQPKPFVNGNSRAPPGSPKKIVLPQKPTAELIETQEEFHIDGVITDPIVQSVSSVVSKFQQIEKSHSPSPSPEPSFKLKFSPAPSPEPQLSKFKSSLEISVKSPPVTPVLSPRIPSPRLHSPSSPIKDTALRQGSPRVHSPPSPMKDLPRQNSSPVHKPPPSPSRELLRQMSAPEQTKVPRTDETALNNTAEHPRQQQSPERIHSPTETEKSDECKFPADAVASDDELAEEEVDAPKTISKTALENIARTGVTMQFSFSDKPTSNKSYLPGFKQNGQKVDEQPDIRNETKSSESRGKPFLSPTIGNNAGNVAVTEQETTVSRLQERLEADKRDRKIEDSKEDTDVKLNVDNKPIGAICSLGLIKTSTTTSYPQGNESKTIRCQKNTESPPQKQIGIIRPLVSTKTQHPQQNLSNRELEKNLINRVKSIEQPTKVVVSLKSAEEIQPAKKTGSGGTGLWETKPWNQQNNTMVFNFSNRKDVPDYIENDGLIIKRKREKPKVGDGGIIVLDATLDASTTDDAEWELTGGPPSPCDVSFFNDNILINGRSNLSRTPRNHKHRIQFDDTATRTFEYPSEASMLEGESSVDGDTSGSDEQSAPISNKTSSTNSTTSLPTLLGGGGGLASYTPSKVDLTSEGFELGVTSRAASSTPVPIQTSTPTPDQAENETDADYLKPAQDAGAWGSETTGDLLY